jgi:hypothetical protein
MTRTKLPKSMLAIVGLATIVTATTATLLTPMVANAYPRTVNQRQWNQQRRIYNGVRDGEIGSREYYNLQRRSDAIELQQRRFRADDGRIDPYERARLNRRLDNLSDSIYRDRRD